MKVIYFGTPEYAVRPLQALVDSTHEVVAVVSQPDKPKGRSNKPVFTPVKDFAIKNNIPVFQFEKIRKDDVSELLKIDADIIVTCAYGQIIGENILFAKKFGVINLHGSLLPKYRGASPIQWSLINGDKTTGVSVLKSGVGMDDGEILMSEEIEIADEDNAITLFEKLSILSADIVIKALDLLEGGNYKYIPQDESKVSMCKMLTQDMSQLDFNKPAKDIVGIIKGLAMWPNAHITIDGVYFKLYNASVVKLDDFENAKNGEVVIANNKKGLIIKCGEDFVEITEFLPINSKKMSPKSYLNGKGIKVGSIVE